MKVVILSGGSGSENIQRGLFEVFDGVEGFDLKVLINAYDNGKSTGVVRQVAGGNILGPSDMRKNQCIRHNAKHGNSSPYYKLLEKRVSGSPEQIHKQLLTEVRVAGSDHRLISAVEKYFLSPTAYKVDYTDFSLANILYAGLAMDNGNSLRAAGSIMAELLMIPDNVILNDDRSLFLCARTESGNEILDEGEIVAWNNPDDKIVDVFFKDSKGFLAKPTLHPEAEKALMEADFIILSTGTLWASLVPTYKSWGFSRVINSVKAPIFMVSNLFPDYDSVSTTGDEIAEILESFFDKGKITLLHDKRCDPILKPTGKFYKNIVEINASYDPSLRNGRDNRHDPYKTSNALLKAFFSDYHDAESYIFDWDDTLVSRGNKTPSASGKNLYFLKDLSNKHKVTICTGNSIKNINKRFDRIDVYADGGANLYRPSGNPEKPFKFIECVNEDLLLNKEEIHSIYQTLSFLEIPISHIENRGNTVISIKPVDPVYRNAIAYAVSKALDFPLDMKNPICVTKTGRTTIEISRAALSKKYAVEKISANKSKVVYVGDEFGNTGNDRPILGIKNIKCLQTKSTAMTYAYLRTLKFQ